MDATERWREGLAAWAIPEPILAAAPESPWGFPVDLFARRADALANASTPSTRHAMEALPRGGVVLDVGCGAGAAALPLAARAGRLVGVDPSPELLGAFRERAEARGVAVTTIVGEWPAAADQAPAADVVVCHHVLYNVPDVVPFVRGLSDHARGRVVVELPVQHPMSPLNELWLHLHGVTRPVTPTVDDAIAVLRELGVAPEQERWTAPAMGWAGEFARRSDLIAWVRRLLCVPAARDHEIEALLAPQLVQQPDGWSLPPRPLVTLWWPGTADA